MRLHPSAARFAYSRFNSRLLVALAAISIACFLPCGWTAQAANSRRTPVVEVVEQVAGAVVNIHSERTSRAPLNEDLFAHASAPLQNHINGMGTGIIIDPRGYIITNHHVVDDVGTIRVRLRDKTSYPARILAVDAENDLALLKIDADRPLPTVPLGTATDLMIGETVIAIGNAYGYEHTVTVGIVSALHRDVALNRDLSYKNLIQTDASINPGNSGGPLLNINGELVGINVAIRAGAQGISFAIPVETMIPVAADMISIKKRKGVWHGLICKDEVLPAKDVVHATAETTATTELTARCLRVEGVEASSPAAKAGLEKGDLVLKVSGTRVRCSLDLERALLDAAPGDHEAILVRRGSTEQKLDLVLQAVDKIPAVPTDLIWRKLGLRLNPVTAELVARTSQQLHGGLEVQEVRADSPAAKAGIQRGDILVGLHQWETLNQDNVLFVLTHKDLNSFMPLSFYILRAGQVHRGWLQQID